MSTWPLPDRPEPAPRPSDERTALDERLEFQRTTLLIKCAGLTPEQLATRACPPSKMSLLGLIRHLSAVEPWFHFFDGLPDHQFFWDYQEDGGNDTSFNSLAIEHADDDLASYLASVDRARAAVAGRSLDDLLTPDNVSLRWIYLHMIEEYARHNGHADLLREAIDGVTGE
jgi:hypothetical protein